MPLVAHSELPTFAWLRQSGHDVLSLSGARNQTIRELHIGLLNMMPDAALKVTERQFLRLLGSSNRVMQIYPHLFAIDQQSRGAETSAYIRRYYEPLEQVQKDGLDALIISGANPQQAWMEDEPFWEPLVHIMEWAHEEVCSVVCSCLATHAYMKYFHQIERIRCQPGKRWGVYSPRRCMHHPLLSDINTRFDAPHSHVYEVTREQLEAVSMRVLAYSQEANMYMATSKDGFRFVFFQGHPEYDRISLLKEMKREVLRYVNRQRDQYPPLPEHYFPQSAESILQSLRLAAEQARQSQGGEFLFPEDKLYPMVDNTWGDTGRAIFNNWLGLVYQLTDYDRKTPFMPGINPSDPLELDDQ